MEKLLRRLFAFVSLTFLALRFVFGKTGRPHGVGRFTKLRLAMQLARNNRAVPSLTTWGQQLMLVAEILQIPPTLEGDVVECGCFNGASTINLSLACALTGRRLFVCDSFEGLPDPEPDEAHDIHGDAAEYYVWEKGEFSCDGGLDGVKKTVERFGNLEVCEFVKGFYSDSLRTLPTESIVLVFEDADLASSVSDCLEHLWPKLQNGCKFYCHEPWSIRVVGLFYDQAWWSQQLGSEPPGFHGSGGGVLAGFRDSAMGYATKFDATAVRESGTKIVHGGSMGFDVPARDNQQPVREVAAPLPAEQHTAAAP